MSRIKFRAWDGEKMHATISIPEWEELNAVFERYPHVLMQFTGLLDKNGKEIFEGDVLSAAVATGAGSAYYDKGEVAFHPDAAQFVLRKGEYATNIGRDVEVIGNIYENPDLLSHEAA